MRPKVKICCINSLAEAKLAIKHGASAIGLVGNMPSGPGVITDDLIFKIAKNTPPPIATFLLTSHTTSSAVISHHKKVHTNTIQIVDTLTDGSHVDIKNILPAVKVVQVIHVLNEATIEQALKEAETADALLLDSGNPNLSVKVLGGTGRTHNWALSRKIVEQSPIPVFLAGGLNPQNARKALEEVQPYGLDICSGVRTNGLLDEQKLATFMNEVFK